MNIIKLAGKPLGVNSKRRIKQFILKNVYFDRLIATYDSWIVENYPDTLDVLQQKNEIKTFTYTPLISITVPTYNTPEQFLHECIGSVLSQSYENWELVLVDDASPDSRVREIIEEYAAEDSRIKYRFLKKNHHIAGATNEAIKLSTGKYIGLFDHDDILWPNALYEVVKALNKEPTIDFLYTDEDKIVEKKSHHAEPFFKPDWSPSLLRTCNYITHFSVFSRQLLDQVGYENSNFNGAQDWEMIMRATRKASKIHHIPKIVYSWRVHDNSTAKSMGSKPYVVDAQRDTISDDLRAYGYNNEDFTISQSSKFFAFWRTTFKNIGSPKVSIITLDKGQMKILKRKTTYRNCEFISEQTYKEGVARATGEYIVLFESGITTTSNKWVETLLNTAIRSDTGLVGGLTIYRNRDYIYSAGITINQDKELIHILSGGISASNLKTLTRTLYAYTQRDTTALSSAVMTRREYVASHRFNEESSSTEQLITLSASLAEKGLNNVYNPDFITRVNQKYVKKKKYENKERRETYKDRLVDCKVDIKKYKNAFTNRYFYDDLVSYPDTDEL